jgi:pyruvate,water dikinase
MTQRWIYFFGLGQADAGSELKHLVGGKGASLADMTRGGLNVPPGFTISTECCAYFEQHQQRWPDDLDAELRINLARLEQISGRTFGRGAQPLLVAVRSGAAQSMPGMMDTVLNVGLNPDCVRAMGERTANPRGAWEAYLHFLLMFAHTVGGIDSDALTRNGSDPDGLDASGLESLCRHVRDVYAEKTGHGFPTDPWEMLCAAVNAVLLSWNSQRAITYRKHHRIDGLLGTAVNVQMMCPAEVAGVMFTANPVTQAPDIIIESSYGLGESVVLGKVTPDRFVLDKSNLAIKERAISSKDRRVAALAEDGKGQTGASDEASLADGQIRDLAKLGRRVEAHFKVPCDIEWALSSGQFFLLQARAIKSQPAVPTFEPAQVEKVRREEIAKLQALAEPGGTVWGRYNLAEILPEPTPMTWSIVQQFMSGRGGFGQMYRDLGFDPDPALADVGVFDLVCGRPYCNLSREPRMQYQSMPFKHDFAWLKKNPDKAIYPQPTFSLRGWSPGAFFGFCVKVPFLMVKMWRSEIKQRQAIRTFAEQFTQEIVPPYLEAVEKVSPEDWSALEPVEVLAHLHVWIDYTLFAFARHSLKPTALAALMLGNLERAFAIRMRPAGGKPSEAMAIGQQKAQAALRELVIGAHPDEHTDLPSGIRALREKRLTRAEFLRRFGHRGSQEMELARPRWSEDHAALDRLIGQAVAPAASKDLEAAWQIAWLRLADEAKVMPQQRPAVEAELRRLQTYMSMRESAKHHLLRGYAVIRRALIELDRRFDLDGGIFYLTLDELPSLVALKGNAEPYLERIEERRRRCDIALSLPLPTVIFSDDLEAIGRPFTVGAAGAMQGVPLSAGVVEAPAWVLEDAAGAQLPHEPYILVCPSTDPAWVPLFVQARGLVMETGGMLSHGAIVAREFGLPAVAGIADVHRRIKTGQRLRIDGALGTGNVVG